MKFSIVTVTYNCQDTIRLTLDSIKGQRYNDYELIIIDGKSTDNTCNIIKEYKDIISCYISENDSGIYNAMNKSLDYCHGDWILFLNSGDRFHNENVLKKVATYISESNTLYYGNVCFKQSGIVYDGEFCSYKLSIHNICHQSIFYPKKAIKKYGYNEKYQLYADWDLNLNILADKTYRFKYLNIIISDYDLDGVSMSRNDANFEKEYLSILKSRLGYQYYVFARVKIIYSLIKSKIHGNKY